MMRKRELDDVRQLIIGYKYARVVEGEVEWSDADVWDGTEDHSYRVYCDGPMIVVEATQWYHSRGEFAVKVTDAEPDEAVLMAHAAYQSFDRMNQGVAA